MNLGSGGVIVEGWTNLDLHPTDHPAAGFVNVLNSQSVALHFDYDYIVCNHMLSDIGHHDLVPALKNVRSMLKDGGMLRILVPNMEKAWRAWMNGDEAWFPQDERTGDINAKFCTFITWFGDSRSAFVYPYLKSLLLEAGFTFVSPPLECGRTMLHPVDGQLRPVYSGITDLDDRCAEALIVEAVR